MLHIQILPSVLRITEILIQSTDCEYYETGNCEEILCKNIEKYQLQLTLHTPTLNLNCKENINLIKGQLNLFNFSKQYFLIETDKKITKSISRS